MATITFLFAIRLSFLGVFWLGGCCSAGDKRLERVSNSGVIGDLGSWGFPAPGLMSGQVAVSRVDQVLGSVIVPECRSKRASNVSVRKKVLVKS